MKSNEEQLAELRASSITTLANLKLATDKLAVLVEEEKNDKKLKKLDNWRVAWAFFMILIVMPAWFFAGVVEGESLSSSFELIANMLRDWLHAPDLLIAIFVWPITIFAKIIPASSTWPFLAIMVLGGGFIIIPIIVFTIFFGYRLPPYFREMKFKIDPFWEAKENKDVIRQPAIRSGPFSSLIAFLVISGLIGAFFIHPNIRTFIADRWAGEIAFIDTNGRTHHLKANIKLNYIDPGYVLDLRPGISQRTLFMEFSGEDLNRLEALGINAGLFKGAERNLPYYKRGCRINEGTVSRSQMYEFKLKDSGTYETGKTQVCPPLVQLDVKGFNEVKLSIMLPGNKNHLESYLTRDSRWGFIEKAMIQNKFQDNQYSLLRRGMGVD